MEEEESNQYRLRALTRQDALHDLQLLRDVAIVNARIVRELGPLPFGGLPVISKRKPALPHHTLPHAYSAPNEDDPMKLRHLAAAASLGLTACTPTNESPDARSDGTTAETKADKSPSMRHKFHVNPNPKRRYDITMTIKDAPGPFDYVRFSAQYDAPDCMYWSDRFAGATSRPMHIINIPSRKLDDSTYVATVYLDGMLDDDYYGNGVCHWKLTRVVGGLKATGAAAETGFGPDIRVEAIIAQESEARFFWKDRYPREEGYENFPEFGTTNLEKVPHDRRNEFFTVTLASKEVLP